MKQDTAVHRLGIAALAGVLCISTAWSAQITQLSPQGKVARVESIKLSFDKSVIAFGEGQAPAPVLVQCDDPELKGNGRWLDDRRWTYVFTQNPGPGVSCDIQLDPSFQALDNGAPVDSSASVPMDGTFVDVDGPVALMEAIAASPQAQHCYAEKWVEFAYARIPTSEDACTVDMLASRMAAGGYTVLDLVTDLTQSESFRHRAMEDAP